MISISLKPYHGEIRLCKTVGRFKAEYKALSGEVCPYGVKKDDGLYVKMACAGEPVVWLISAGNIKVAAHEFAHVLLHVFNDIGHDPRQGDGEPFCYMLSHLLDEASLYIG
jgi:hypothetical protein